MGGVVFKLSPGGTETVLYSFEFGGSDGASPNAGLIADCSGNLYGTTPYAILKTHVKTHWLNVRK